MPNLIDLAKKDVIRDYKNYLDNLKRCQELIEAVEVDYPSIELPADADVCMYNWSGSLTIRIPWDINLADSISRDLEEQEWELANVHEREETDLHQIFEFRKADTKYKIYLTMSANAYPGNGQTCRVEKVGEKAETTVRPVYKIVCDEVA